MYKKARGNYSGIVPERTGRRENMKEQITILAASNNPDCLDNVGLYTIMLAKRTGMMACLLFVLQEEKRRNDDQEGRKNIQEKALRIQEAGAKAKVRIDCMITTGHFVDEVAKYIRVYDSPILIVGEGDCKIMRKKELRKVEKILRSKGDLHKGRGHHFLVISDKSKIADTSKEQAIIDWINMNQF